MESRTQLKTVEITLNIFAVQRISCTTDLTINDNKLSCLNLPIKLFYFLKRPTLENGSDSKDMAQGFRQSPPPLYFSYLQIHLPFT